MLINRAIFKAYDVRGVYPTEIDETAVYRIGQAYAEFLKPKTVAVGRDVRISSPSLQAALIDGLTSMGVGVVDIGLGPTEMIYFAVGSRGYDGAIQVSASHNPAEYNGLKMVRGEVAAISSDTGLFEIRDLAASDKVFHPANKRGGVTTVDLSGEYLDWLSERVGFTDASWKIVANNNFGLSGPLFERLLKKTKAHEIELVGLNFEADGRFPKGRPDPLVPENRAELTALVKETKADLGLAWDADGDRLYIVDENGQFIEGCHLTAALARYLLKNNPGEAIIYDPRNVRAVEETVREAGGRALINKAGHTFIKNRMKAERALFAGEMSGHFYFREFFGADSGLLPVIYFLNYLFESGSRVSDLLRPWRERYFVSGEINFQLPDPRAVLAALPAKLEGAKIDRTDGLSFDLGNWRCNLRLSNTEPLLRLNVEADSSGLCQEKTAELKALIDQLKTAL